MYDCTIVGGGIVGLATAMTLVQRQPGLKLLLVEKESDFAQHQSGRNSGVIHSGIYYKPGSFKAKFAREGSRTMVEFCREHGIKYDVCGKVIIAVEEKELPLLDNLYKRGLQNELNVTMLTPQQVKEIEPHVRSVAGIKVPSTGVADYKGVCRKYAELARKDGGTIHLGTRLLNIRNSENSKVLETDKGEFETRFLINCAGLHSDRVAKFGGLQPEAKIVPFRGEYFELVPNRRFLVKSLIYPVPNPDFPFLGVHFTRMIDGSIHCGPNAVLAFKREGYHKTDFNLRDFCETMTYGGFWKLAKKNMSEGLMEMRRSLSKNLFLKSLQRLIPEVQLDDIIPCHAGVRAQAMLPNGGMVDDFLFQRDRNAVHVCNAPSPAATASLEIGKSIADQIPELRTRATVGV